MQSSGCSDTEVCEGQIIMGSRNAERRQWAWSAPMAEHGNRNGYLELGIPSAVLRRQQWEYEIPIHFVDFGGIDYSVLNKPEPVEIEWWED